MRAAMHMLPLPGVQGQAWDALADKVRRTGRVAVRGALGDQRYPVPSVAGATGATLLSCPLVFLPLFVSALHHVKVAWAGNAASIRVLSSWPFPGDEGIKLWACLGQACCR